MLGQPFCDTLLGVWPRAEDGPRAAAVERLAEAMAEAGIDISGHTSNTIEATDPETLDLVVTVCDHAHESCPIFPGDAEVIHRGFDDPPRLAADARDDDEALPHYRRVRDEIRDFINQLPAELRAIGHDVADAS